VIVLSAAGLLVMLGTLKTAMITVIAAFGLLLVYTMLLLRVKVEKK
jgi:hypothetical protein